MTSTPMDAAIDEAKLAFLAGEVPVGAVIVFDGEIIARASNLTVANNDPTGHAEIRAIRIACEILNTQRLNQCDLFVTLEPCTMCAAAISFARIRRLYYAAPDIKGGGVENGVRFYNQITCHHKPEIYSGLNEQQSARLLKEFFEKRRPLKEG